jgi:hypothetical protein
LPERFLQLVSKLGKTAAFDSFHTEIKLRSLWLPT